MSKLYNKQFLDETLQHMSTELLDLLKWTSENDQQYSEEISELSLKLGALIRISEE